MKVRMGPSHLMKLGFAAPALLILGVAALLFGIVPLGPAATWPTLRWLDVIVGALLGICGVASLLSFTTSVRLRARVPLGDNVCFWSASATMAIVVLIALNWNVVLRALGLFLADDGWAAFGDRPTTTHILGSTSVHSLDGEQYFIVHASGGLGVVTTPHSNGCFVISGVRKVTTFSSYAPGYQKVEIPIGSGYFLLDVTLAPDGSAKQSQAVAKTLSAFQFIRGMTDCEEPEET